MSKSTPETIWSFNLPWGEYNLSRDTVKKHGSYSIGMLIILFTGAALYAFGLIESMDVPVVVTTVFAAGYYIYHTSLNISTYDPNIASPNTILVLTSIMLIFNIFSISTVFSTIFIMLIFLGVYNLFAFMMSSNNYKISVFIGAVTAGSIGYAYVVSSAYADHPEKGTAITLFILVYIAIGTSIAYKLQQYVEEHRGNLWEHTLDQISKINTKRKELAQTDTAKKVKKNLQLNNLLSMRQDTFIALIYVSMASLVVALVGFFADWPFFVGLAFAAFIGMLWKHLLEKFENVYNGLLVATVPLILILLLTGSGLGWLVSSIFLGSAYYYIDLAIYDKADLLPKNHILQSESTDELSDERFWTYLTSIFICIAIILWHKFGYDPDVDGMLRGLSTVITSIVLTFTHGIVLTVSIDRKLLVMHRWLKKNTTNDSDQKEDSD